jgi:hypothetical protein
MILRRLLSVSLTIKYSLYLGSKGVASLLILTWYNGPRKLDSKTGINEI